MLLDGVEKEWQDKTRSGGSSQDVFYVAVNEDSDVVGFETILYSSRPL